MKRFRYLLIIITLTISIFGFHKKTFASSIFYLVKTRTFVLTGLSKMNDIGYNNDIIFTSPSLNKNFFDSIDDLSICYRKDVRYYIHLYLTKGRHYLHNGLKRANKYKSEIEEIFDDNKDIPRDIALLPLLESAFNPYAVSRSKAVGMWQIIGTTSKSLGLKVNRWVDERRDIEKSTKAAIRHLRNLYKTFKSWELALAAYNGGANHVKKAMKKTGANSLLELQKSGALKRETSEYVPRFAALLVIYKNQHIFDIKKRISDKPELKPERIALDYPVNIYNISKISGVPVKTLRMYNPELKKNMTPPYSKNYMLKIPKDIKEKLEKNRSKLYQVSYKKLKKHTVKKGECISRIAKLYKTKAKKIIVINGIKNPRKIRPGLELFIPI